MAGRAFDAGRDALEFIEALGALNDAGQILGALRSKLGAYGFHAFLVTGLPDAGNRIDPLVLINGWPDGWFDLYTKRAFADVDPIVAHCKRSRDPFAWADIYCDAKARPREREVMDRARDFAMREGFCVPIHGEEGFQAVVTMAGDKPDLSRNTRRAIHLMAIYAHSRASRCLRPKPKQETNLTVREREVLTWMATGLSTKSVADRLGIAAGTAEAHYENAARKLGVRGRVRAIVEAYRAGQITL